MKTTERICAVRFDNRKRVLHVDYASGKRIGVHYGHLGITQKVVGVWVDKETRGRSIGIRLQDGSEEYMPYDQPLALARDPEYLLRTQLERVLARIRETLTAKGVSKRYLATQLESKQEGDTVELFEVLVQDRWIEEPLDLVV